jgi:ATP-dependent DNA helicase DinG
VLSGLGEIEEFAVIADWEKTTETGDRAELRSLPEISELWKRIDARADACSGQKCPSWEKCFITEMRRKALESDIVIVNHHLFFADLAIKQYAAGAPDAGVLPEFSMVVFDEAHELEEVAGSYFGVSVSNVRFDELLRDCENQLKLKQLFTPAVKDACTSLHHRVQFFFSMLPQGKGRFAFSGRAEVLEEKGDEYSGLMSGLGRLASALQGLPEKPEEVHTFIRRAEELKMQLGFIMESQAKNTVFWIERRVRRGRHAGKEDVFLQATPIDVSQILRQTLFENLEAAIMTSATLAVSGGFDYIKTRLGLDHARELVVPSHFDYERQAILYVPPDMPDPRSPDYAHRAAERIRQVLEISRGRAFCLFTSYAQMNDIHERLLGEIEYPMLLQGSAPKSALLEEFRMTPHAVLFGTSSFWQGVDVQGEQLSCVIIDRLPFAVPNDPIVAARVKAVSEDGGNAFYEYQVPAAVITLKQGFGRLIRSLNDRGALVLLDNRVLRQRYGKVFLDSLPRYRHTTSIADVEKFFSASYS